MDSLETLHCGLKEQPWVRGVCVGAGVAVGVERVHPCVWSTRARKLARAAWAFVVSLPVSVLGPGASVSSIFQVGLFPVSWLPRFSVRTGERSPLG